MTAGDVRELPNILIVDDTPANLLLLERMFTSRRYRVRTVLQGEAALETARNEPPDLILLDINMPDMDGFELCRQLKADELLREIPVIFMSVRNETMDKVKAFDLGGVDYVTKPFQLEEVYSRVATHLQIRTLQRRLSRQNEELQRLSAENQDARKFAEEIVNTVQLPLMVLNSDLRILTANQSFYDTFKVTPRETMGNVIHELGNRQWDIPQLRRLLENLLGNGSPFNGYEVEYDFPGCGHKIILLNAQLIYRETVGENIILLAMEEITHRVAAEKKIIRANNEWRATFDIIPDLITVIDTNHRIIKVNRAMASVLKVDADDARGMTCYRQIHCTAAAPNNCPHRRLLADGQEHKAEIFEERLGGWFQITATPIHNFEGRLMGSVHVAHDITELKLLESRIQDAREYAEDIVETLCDPLVVLDSDLMILTANRSFYDTFQVTAEVTIGNYIYDLGNRQWDIPKLRLLFENIIHNDSVFTGYEVEHEFPVIGRRSILLNARHISRKSMDSNIILLTMQDITARKQTEELLLQSEQDLRSILDGIPAVIGCWDQNLHCRFANSAYLEWFHMDPEAIRGKDLREVIGEKSYQENLPHIQGALRGEPQFFERSMTSIDGADINHFQLSYIPNSLNGEVLGFYVMRTDVSRIKNAEHAAEAAKQAKSDFLATISHELRTPMNAIIGFGQLTLQTDLTTKQRDYVGKIATSAKGLMLILNDLLDFSKIEAGKVELEALPFALNPLLERLRSLVEIGASAKGLRLRLSYDSKCPEYLVGDSYRLQQILLNLLSNAIKFTSAGEVELSVRPLTAEQERVLMEFSVRDSGIGLSPEQLGRIFTPFTQADSSTTRRYGGTGLGLSICRRLALLLGGEIYVVSEPGRGSTFTCTVPLLRGELPMMEPDQAPDQLLMEKALKGSRILVAEDQEINRQLLRELLEQVGVSVTVVADGRQAVAAVAEAKSFFHAILMDLQMPELDGYGATLLLREQWPMDRLPIIAMTAHAMKEVRERCLAGGMNDHLSKPVNPNQLYACLTQWVRSDFPQESIPKDNADTQSHGMLTIKGPNPSPEKRSDDSISGRNILIVDDEPASIIILNGMLPEHHTCMAATDGVTALELALCHQPHLILLDTEMPDIHGHELCRTLKGNPATSQIPIILLTSTTAADDIVKGFTAGAVDYIAKPFNSVEVNARVNTHLQYRWTMTKR